MRPWRTFHTQAKRACVHEAIGIVYVWVIHTSRTPTYKHLVHTYACYEIAHSLFGVVLLDVNVARE